MRRASLVVTFALFLAACGSDSKEAVTGATVRKEIPPSTSAPPVTRLPADPASYVVPPTIDAAYVEHVMGALDHLLGNAIREVVRTRTLNEEYLRATADIYTAKEFDDEQTIR